MSLRCADFSMQCQTALFWVYLPKRGVLGKSSHAELTSVCVCSWVRAYLCVNAARGQRAYFSKMEREPRPVQQERLSEIPVHQVVSQKWGGPTRQRCICFKEASADGHLHCFLPNYLALQ